MLNIFSADLPVAGSPLLFGAVCCVSSFFLDAPNGEAGLQLYLSLVALVNETLARESKPSECAEGTVLTTLIRYVNQLSSCRLGAQNSTMISFLAWLSASYGKPQELREQT
jgi:hypothetical protein